MVSYLELIDLIKNLKSNSNILFTTKGVNSNILITTKGHYFVIKIPGINYHLTVFQDQWDDYASQMGKPYHLFHISSDENKNRCSSYFWIGIKDHLIYHIPKKYFKYEQDSFGTDRSTRKSCEFNDVKPILKMFKNILKSINIHH